MSTEDSFGFWLSVTSVRIGLRSRITVRLLSFFFIKFCILFCFALPCLRCVFACFWLCFCFASGCVFVFAFTYLLFSFSVLACLFVCLFVFWSNEFTIHLSLLNFAEFPRESFANCRGPYLSPWPQAEKTKPQVYQTASSFKEFV